MEAMATINGGSGDDTLSGTSGDDTIVGGEGADSIDAGAGDDSIHGDDAFASADGGDTIDAGDGADTVFGAEGDDSIQGGAGADSLFGGDGDDFVDGGDGNDTIYGVQGNNTLHGGDGNDLIYGADGDEEMRGGSGDDTLHGYSGADSFVITADSGNDVIEDYNAGDGDILVIDYPGITTYAELEPYLSDDGDWGTLISLPDGSVTQVKWLNYNSQSASDFSFQSGPVCFLKGTLIDTAKGPRPIETLRPGDLIETLDNGMKPIRFISHRCYKFKSHHHKMKPIRIRPNALGPDTPTRELLVSPQHRIALPQHDPTCIVAAKKLLGLPGVMERPSCQSARYYHLLLEQHQLVRANGAWAETLLVTEYTNTNAWLPNKLRQIGMRPIRKIEWSVDNLPLATT
jgi:hypothetical protein